MPTIELPGREAPPAYRDRPAHSTDGRIPFPIVGIGASAGGLETFSQLLSHLPNDTGMGFVYVQHLDPRHESMLTQLLSKATPMPVHEARDGMAVEPNHVYIIPPATNLGLLGGRLALMPRGEGSEQHMSVDYFLRSLADDHGERAIGVILSGTASDGTLGLQAIKAQGGLTFAQDPTSAKYDGMPRSAINACVADFVLSPEGIARELASIGKHPLLAFPRIEEHDLALGDNDGDLSKIFIMLRVATGVDFSHYKLTTIKRRIVRRMLLGKIDNIADYARHLKNNAAEIDALYQDLLINVTSFFRDPETIETLTQQVFPRLLAKSPGDGLRIWVPGCATGEEAYSLAISLLECAGDASGNVAIQIFATDISDAAIEKARSGVYSENAVSGISRERLRRFFVKVEGGYQVKKTIRDLCLFARQDLSKDPPFSRLDLVSCRNVLIYLSAALQRKIIPTFHYALNPGGVLVLGTSETIGGFADLFGLLDKKNKIYTKKTGVHRPSMDFRSVAPLPGVADASHRSMATEAPEPDARKEADRIVLKKYAPASVLVNESLDILQFRGRTGDYLEPASGSASLNLLKMAREGLVLELRNLIQRARKQNAAVHGNVRFRSEGRDRRLALDVTPLKPPGARERYLLVTFDSSGRHGAGAPSGRKRPARGARTQRISQLQQELAVTNEYLQSTIDAQEATNEELRSALEEIQSANEELQSVNEELETAKEELQSTNEELTTVNDELQNRNADLDQVNNDLMNLLSSVNIAVIILGEDLRIRRFTPMAEKLLNLIPSDVGRPLADLRVNFIIPNLHDVIHEVMDTLATREIDMQGRDGRWYSARVRPYKTMDNRIDGVVLALVDIDTLRGNLINAEKSRDYAESIIDTVREPLLILDGLLRIHGANRSYYEKFQTTPAQTENRFLYELGDGWRDNDRLRSQLKAMQTNGASVDRFELEGEFPGIGRRRLLLNATRIQRADEKPELILLAIKDITDSS